jgi:hypothetical protein
MASIYKTEPGVLREDILRTLVFEGEKTAHQLACRWLVARDKIIGELAALQRDGKVASFGAIGDCYCSQCNAIWPESEPGKTCPGCRREGVLKDDCQWRAVPPFSEALKVA